MWFKRKRKNTSVEIETEKKLCFHDWKLLDVSVIWTDNGYESDFYELFKLGCTTCGSTRKVDGLEYSKLEEHGLVKDQLSDKNA